MVARTIFIREVVTTAAEPGACPTCGKRDRLERGGVREGRSDGQTFLCTRCEALVVVTDHVLREVDLSPVSEDDTIMLKEPHLIRRVAY